jgi:cell wall-associated NlpC family hydrolase
MKKTTRLLRFVLMLTVVIASLVVVASATELKLGVGIVESNGLRLRAKASTSADILATASYGDTVVVIRDTGDGWYLVDYNLEIGYMSKDYITFKTAENVELGDGMANTAVVNLRATPSADGALVTQMSQGSTARIIGINNTFYKVVYNGNTGYVRSDLLTLTEAPLSNSTSGSSSTTSSIGSQIVSYAYTFLGTRYVWGGTTPSGFDCSGYTQYVFKNLGYSLNRTAAQQLNNGYSVSKSELQPGDLVFFANTYSSSEAATHVGIYVGDGKFIHAASGGVKVTALSESYYASRYVGARRIAG